MHFEYHSIYVITLSGNPWVSFVQIAQVSTRLPFSLMKQAICHMQPRRYYLAAWLRNRQIQYRHDLILPLQLLAWFPNEMNFGNKTQYGNLLRKNPKPRRLTFFLQYIKCTAYGKRRKEWRPKLFGYRTLKFELLFFIDCLVTNGVKNRIESLWV